MRSMDIILAEKYNHIVGTLHSICRFGAHGVNFHENMEIIYILGQ